MERNKKMIKELDIPVRKKYILAKKGIVTTDDLLSSFLPRSYKDYRKEYSEVSEDLNGCSGCFIGKPYNLSIKYKDKRSIITFKLRSSNDKQINICIIGQNFMGKILERMMEECNIAVFGTMEYKEPFGFSILSPDHICYLDQKELYKRVEPVYSKISGISSEWMETLIKDTFREYNEEETFSKSVLLNAGFNYPSKKEAIANIHFPKNLEDIDLSKKRLEFDELYNFASRFIEEEKSVTKGTTVVLKDLSITKKLIDELPYELTSDQKNTVNQIIKEIREGRRVSALVQGDVGCGKTLVAIILMFAFAENGYQCALMAPTQILAKQHYNQIKEFGDKYGIEVGYLDGSTKSSERKSIITRVHNVNLKILVGTHTIALEEKLNYNNLGLVIVDEEHRFGVEIRDKLFSHAKEGVSQISMTATPIPRSLSKALFGSNTKIYDIYSMPANRKEVKTGICSFSEEHKIFDFVTRELEKGRQVYVICPTIDDSEDDMPLKRNRSLVETQNLYQGILDHKYKLDTVSSKLDALEIDAKISAFRDGEIDVLISTTVIEVGVNVPNASTIIIQNAERFGLAQLHQLRGRVGRGEHQSYCILLSEDSENEKLQTMKNCSDGFNLSIKDLALRGAGDLIGVEQSGFSRILTLINQNQELYSRIYDFILSSEKVAV